MSGGGRAIVAACIAGIAATWNVVNIGAIASGVARAYDVDLATVGLLGTALFAAHMLAQIPGGRACDRFGARRVVLAGTVILLVGNAAALVAPDPALGLAARAVTGFGAGLAFISGSALVREWAGPMAQGLYGGVALGGGGVALAVVPQLEAALEWRAPYWSALAVAVVAAALVAAAPSDPPGRRSSSMRPQLRTVVLDRSLYPIAFVFAATFALTIVIGNWVVELLMRNAGFDNGTAGLLGSLTLLLAVVTRPLGGWLGTAHPARVRAAVASSLVVCAAGTLALMAASSVWLAATGAALVGLAGGVAFAPAFTGAAVTRPDAPAAAVGLVNSFAAFVMLTGTPLVGVTFSLPGDGRLGFAAIAALMLAALAFLPPARGLGVAPAPVAARAPERARRGAR